MVCTLTLWGQTSSSGEIQADSDYSVKTWRVILMINDAYRVRVQDTLILRLDDRVRILESEKASLNSNCSSEVKALTEKIAVQKDQGDIEKSLKEYYKIESRKHKRQRNGMIGVLGAVAVYGVRSIFKPP